MVACTDLRYRSDRSLPLIYSSFSFKVHIMKMIYIRKLSKHLIDERDVRNNSSNPLIFDRVHLSGRYFVYFFGPDFEYSWSDTYAMIPYSSLEDFIKQAEINVQKVGVFLCSILSLFIRISSGYWKERTRSIG